jgi:hypothetical protein
LIGLTEKAAEAEKRPLFVGEFGGSRKVGDKTAQAQFKASLDAVVRSGVPLAAFWVFDLPSQNDDWNVEFNNGRAYQLDLVTEANGKFYGPAP